MSRRTLINLLQSIFPPTVNQGMVKDMIGAESSEIILAAETEITLDFTLNKFFILNLGSANITLNATVLGLKVGERVYLKIIQDGTGARTVTWGSNILTDATVSSSTDDIDMFMGVFDGVNIILGALAQNVA